MIVLVQQFQFLLQGYLASLLPCPWATKTGCARYLLMVKPLARWAPQPAFQGILLPFFRALGLQKPAAQDIF